jgi:cold shock protein
MARGTVREWHDEDGWGVIDSPETPGGCWVLHSHIELESLPSLTVGQEVTFTFESVTWQDGYRWRAVSVRPDGDHPPSGRRIESAPSSVYRSSLTIEFDE